MLCIYIISRIKQSTPAPPTVNMAPAWLIKDRNKWVLMPSFSKSGFSGMVSKYKPTGPTKLNVVKKIVGCALITSKYVVK